MMRRDEQAERSPATATGPTVGQQVLRALADAVEAAGGSRSAFLRAIARDERDLSATAERLSLRDITAFCEQAMVVSRDPALGLHWAEGLAERDFGPVSHLLSHTGSLRRGFELLARFEPLFSDQRSYEVLEHTNTMSIRMIARAFDTPSVERFTAEMLLGGMLKMVRAFSASARPRVVRFRFAAPHYHAEYERVFGTEVRFDQSVTELVFARGLLDQPSPHGDQDMHAALRTVAEQRLVRLTRSTSLAVRLRQYLLARLPERANMETAARALGLSVRSLRRQLTLEGATYREIEYAVLEQAARRLLCDKGLTIQETAHELGFSEAATFHRAFKTWTGCTPSEYRERAFASHAPRQPATR